MKWSVAKDGYEVVDVLLGLGEDKQEIWAKVVRPVRPDWVEPDGKGWWSRPVDRKALGGRKSLHVEFSRIKTPDDVCAFAAKYGLLGLHDIDHAILDAAGFAPCEDGELLGSWLGYADMVRKIRAAHAKNKRVYGRLKPQTLLNRLFEVAPVQARLVRRKETFVLEVEPSSLFAAILLSLGRELAGMHARKVCIGCGQAFWIGKERRSDMKYCSHACRIRAYRRRKAALQNARKGP